MVRYRKRNRDGLKMTIERKLLGTNPSGSVIDVVDVFSTALYTGNGSSQSITNDIDISGEGGLVTFKKRSGTGPMAWFDTERGVGKFLGSHSTGNEDTSPGGKDLTAFSSDGFSLGSSYHSDCNNSGSTYTSWTFRKAPTFFDIVTYTGNGTVGRTVAHSLEAPVGMLIVKKRSGAESWAVYHEELGGTKYARLNISNAPSTSSAEWNNTAPTDTVFTVGSDGIVNGNGGTYVAYLFASLDGVSKTGSFTGNGTSITVDCGFSAGAAYVLIKRTDAAGDWYIWDSERGIVSGNDPYLLVNEATYEVTDKDLLDPHNSGFIVNQVSPKNNNVSGGTYIYYAVANP